MKIRVDSSRDAERTLVRWANAICVLIVVLMVVSVATRSVSAALPKAPAFREQRALKGSVRPTRATAIHAESAGRVAAVLVHSGDPVGPGQLLMELENEELSTLAETARSRFAQAQRRLAAVERRGIPGLRSQIQKEKYSLALRQWDTAQKRLAAFSLTEYENALKSARARLERLRAQKEPPDNQIDRAESAVGRETRALEGARERWTRLRQEAEVADSRLKIEKALLQLEESTELAAARAAYQDAGLDLRITNQRVAQLRITAPRAGTILEVPVLADDRVYAGAPLVRMADLSSLEVEVPVPAKLLRHVAAGDSVAVRLPLDPDMDLAASVSSVSAVPDPVTHAYAVRMHIGNPNPKLILAGLECAVSFPKIEQATKPWWRRMLGL